MPQGLWPAFYFRQTARVRSQLMRKKEKQDKTCGNRQTNRHTDRQAGAKAILPALMALRCGALPQVAASPLRKQTGFPIRPASSVCGHALSCRCIASRNRLSKSWSTAITWDVEVYKPSTNVTNKDAQSRTYAWTIITLWLQYDSITVTHPADTRVDDSLIPHVDISFAASRLSFAKEKRLNQRVNSFI